MCLQLRLFNTTTGDCELLSAHSDIVLAVDTSSDKKCALCVIFCCVRVAHIVCRHLATASKDNTVCVWRHTDSGFTYVSNQRSRLFIFCG